MFTQIVSLLLGTAADLLALGFLARAWMQWTRMPFRNPLGRFVTGLTDWAVLPLRRVVPGLFGVDLASVLAAWLAQFVFALAMLALAAPDSADTFAAALWVATLVVLHLFVYLLMGVVIISAVLSWFSPHSPFTGPMNTLAGPLLGPVRRVLPPIGGIDLSPLVVILLLQVVLIVLSGLGR